MLIFLLTIRVLEWISAKNNKSSQPNLVLTHIQSVRLHSGCCQVQSTMLFKEQRCPWRSLRMPPCILGQFGSNHDSFLSSKPESLGGKKKSKYIYISLSQFCLCPLKRNLILTFLCLLFNSCRMYFMVCLFSGTGKWCCDESPCSLGMFCSKSSRGYDKMINSLWNDPSSPAWRLASAGSQNWTVAELPEAAACSPVLQMRKPRL